MRMLYRPSKEFVAALITIAVVVITTVWIWWAISQAKPAVRAVSDASHQVCGNMPRGSQEMENGRKQCFEQLYAFGRPQAGR